MIQFLAQSHRHDGLARAGIVSHQEAKGGVEHRLLNPVIWCAKRSNCGSTERQSADQRGRTLAQPLGFGDKAEQMAVSGKAEGPGLPGPTPKCGSGHDMYRGPARRSLAIDKMKPNSHVVAVQFDMAQGHHLSGDDPRTRLPTRRSRSPSHAVIMQREKDGCEMRNVAYAMI